MSIVKVGEGRYAAEPQISDSVNTIDGYVFVGMPYYYTPESQFANPTDPSKWVPAPINAVNTWCTLQADPDYASLPPVTSISVDVVVSGTVDAGPATPPATTPSVHTRAPRVQGARGTRF